MPRSARLRELQETFIHIATNSLSSSHMTKSKSWSGPVGAHLEHVSFLSSPQDHYSSQDCGACRGMAIPTPYEVRVEDSSKRDFATELPKDQLHDVCVSGTGLVQASLEGGDYIPLPVATRSMMTKEAKEMASTRKERSASHFPWERHTERVITGLGNDRFATTRSWRPSPLHRLPLERDCFVGPKSINPTLHLFFLLQTHHSQSSPQ